MSIGPGGRACAPKNEDAETQRGRGGATAIAVQVLAVERLSKSISLASYYWVRDRTMKVDKCNACGKTATDLFTCGGCGDAKYCRKSCQLLHWPFHIEECKGKKMKPRIFPKSVDAFLAQRDDGGPEVVKLFLFDGLGSTNTDQWFAALIASGLVQACFQAQQNARYSSKEKADAKSLIKIAIESDISWRYLDYYNTLSFEHNSKRWFGVQASPGLLPKSLESAAEQLCSVDQYFSLIRMMMLKLALKGIRLLAQHGGHHDDAELNMYMTRLFVRCLLNHQSFLNIPLLELGASSAERWEKEAAHARMEYEEGGIASKLVTLGALDEILERPNKQDFELCQWLLKPETLKALAGWIASKTWKCELEVAIRAESWQKLRALLYVGAQGSAGTLTKAAWRRKTLKATQALRKTGMEQADGSTKKMPEVIVDSDYDPDDDLSSHGDGHGDSDAEDD